MTVQTKPAARLRRRRRVRAKVRGSAARPRISVFRSNRGISAQLIDDDAGRTLVAVNWTEAELRSLKPVDQAHKAGELLAQRAKDAGVDTAVFDRGGYQYHGRVKALAEGAREGGLRSRARPLARRASRCGQPRHNTLSLPSDTPHGIGFRSLSFSAGPRPPRARG